MKKTLISLTIILVLTGVSFYPTLSNGFVNWDDEVHLLDNPFVRQLTWESTRKIFTSMIVWNYHPLTILSWAAEYHFFKYNPAIYHLNNLILHLLNTALVFWFVFRVSGQRITAIVAALLFGIHPLHVESVAWVTERKDVLFAFFYLAGLVSYVAGVQTKRNWCHWLTLFLFFFSLLAKPAAVSFPLALLTVDYYMGRTMNGRAFLDKSPFFLLSFIFGIIMLYSAEHATSYGVLGYSWAGGDFFLFTTRALFLYLEKLILPLNLSCLYPYPDKVSGSFPQVFYWSPFVCVVIGVLVFKSAKWTRDVSFAMLFFLATGSLNFPFLGQGHAIIADRFMYIPSIGLFIMIGRWVNHMFAVSGYSKNILKWSLLLGGFMAVLCLSFLTWERCAVWRNSLTLWDDVIKKNKNVAVAYYSRGNYHFAKGNADLALADYNEAIRIAPYYTAAYNNRGNIFVIKGDYGRAIEDYGMAIRIEPPYLIPYFNRASCYAALGEIDRALADYDSILRFDPVNVQARILQKKYLKKRE